GVAPPNEGFYCTIHGDFWHGNIMAAGHESRLTGVLDWDRSEAESLPFLDLFHLFVPYEVQYGGMDWGHSVCKLHKALVAESPDTELIRTYARQIGAPKSLAAASLIVYWMR